MNKEILFRGKRIDNGEWVYGNLIASDAANEAFETIIIPDGDFMYLTEPDCDLGFETWYKVKPDTVCQYTGFVDTHNHKIFENDIIYRSSRYDHGDVCKVIFQDGEYLGEDILTGSTCTMKILRKEWEIINNIFDIPVSSNAYASIFLQGKTGYKVMMGVE
jgi:uncharacterized phage protein (TIGR01671 family)